MAARLEMMIVAVSSTTKLSHQQLAPSEAVPRHLRKSPNQVNRTRSMEQPLVVDVNLDHVSDFVLRCELF